MSVTRLASPIHVVYSVRQEREVPPNQTRNWHIDAGLVTQGLHLQPLFF